MENKDNINEWFKELNEITENNGKLSEWLNELNDMNKKQKEINKKMESQGIETLIKEKHNGI